MSVGVLHRCGEIRVIRLEDRTDVTDFAAEHAYDLESEDGTPFEGLRENADFWRWLLTMIRGEPMWIPPQLQGGDTNPTPGESNKEAGP